MSQFEEEEKNLSIQIYTKLNRRTIVEGAAMDQKRHNFD